MPQKHKILLIEDDEAIREMYRIKFDMAGIDVAIAEDGKDGLKLAKKFRPDLLLLDLKIPTMGGEDVLEALQTNTDWGKNMKVMIMSNITRDVAPKKLNMLSIDRYLVKAHYTPTQVVKIVKEMLETLT